MTVYGLWFGGNGRYSVPTVEDHLEEFRSMMHAISAFEERYNSQGRYPCETHYVGNENYRTCYPNVGEDCTMEIFLYDPREYDAGPDKIISFGPLMGVRVRRT